MKKEATIYFNYLQVFLWVWGFSLHIFFTRNISVHNTTTSFSGTTSQLKMVIQKLNRISRYICLELYSVYWLVYKRNVWNLRSYVASATSLMVFGFVSFVKLITDWLIDQGFSGNQVNSFFVIWFSSFIFRVHF